MSARNISERSVPVNSGTEIHADLLIDRLKSPAGAVLLGLACVALLFRVASIDHGFPDVNEEATPVRQAWEMWAWETGGLDLNPRFFNYPALTFYLNWAAQAVYRLATDPTGLRAWGPADDLALDLVLIGRILSLLLTVVLALLTWRLGRLLMPTVAAAWSAVIILWMPTLFHYSVFSIVDIPLAVLSAVILVRLTANPPATVRDHAITGVLVGLATSSKYTGAFLSVPYLLALLVAARWDVRRVFLAPGPWIAGLASVVVFFALNPYVILDYDTFRWHFAFERHHMAVGHFGRERGPVAEYAVAAWYNLGPFCLAALVAAAVAAVRSRDARWIPLAGFGLLYPCFLLAWSTSFAHYLFPIFPVLAVASALGLSSAADALSSRLPRQAVSLAFPLLAILPLAHGVWDEYDRFRTPAPRTLARAWLIENVADGAIVANEQWGPELPASVHEVLLPMHTTDPDQATPVYHPGWYDPFDMFIVVEGVERRYRSDPERFPDQVGLYDHLAARWEERTRFGRPGEGIRVYANPREDRDGIRAYPDSLYNRLPGMSRVLAGRFMDRLGTAYRDAGRLTFAHDVYSRLAAFLPDEQDYTLAYADILLSLNRRDLAIRFLETRRESGDDHLRASLHFLKGETDSAAAAWSRFAEAHPGNIRVRTNLARVFLSMGHSEEALAWYLDAIDLGVDDPEAYQNAAVLLRRTGKPNRSVAIAAEGLERWPDHEGLRRLAAP